MVEETQQVGKKTAETDWAQVALLVLRSRLLDELEEKELALGGEVPYQFSARGHELAQVLLALRLDQPHDATGVYYRSRPFMLASGLTLREALAAGMGRTGSPSEGRDVGVVFSLPSRGGATVLPSSGDVGAQYTPIAGWAQAIRYRADHLNESEWAGSIAVALGGDGSVAANGFWSALTMATTLRLPMLFFIEDNRYGISVPHSFQTPGGDIAANLNSFQDLHVLSGPGTDPYLTDDLIQQAVDHVRSGEGACLLKLDVPRLGGHTFVDNQAYKSKEELEMESKIDPLDALEKLLGASDFEMLKQEARRDVAQALEEARSLPPPEPGSGEQHLFFDGSLQQVGGTAVELGLPEEIAGNEHNLSGARINMIDAVRTVMEQELEANPRMLVFGEDVGVKGGVHGATIDLQAQFGETRVFDTSLSEEGIIGRAVGMALAGLLPLPEIQFRKYADPATEQLNDCGTLRWRTAGKFAAPMVVRMPVGYGKVIGDPWHSVTGEAVYAHSPGWRIAFPSNAADAAGLMRTALRGQDPTFFLEHRALLDTAPSRRPDPGPSYMLPFGQAATLLGGDELTLVTWGATVHASLEACQAYEGRVELLDLRTISPWDREAVLASVRNTGKCLVVHEDTWTVGFGAEILSTLATEAFESLDGPLRRLATPDMPVPYSRPLMKAVIPTAEKIQAEIEDLLAY